MSRNGRAGRTRSKRRRTGATFAQIQNQAYAVAATTGFTNGQHGVTVTVNNPPATGPNTANTSAYEVIIKQPQTGYFAALLLHGTAAPTVIGRAVMFVSGTPACLLALNTAASSAIGMSGGASVGATNCTVAANSSSGTAVTGSGGASLTASNLNIVGNYSTSGGFTIAPSTNIKTSAPATADPYASLAVPAVGACTQTNFSKSGGWTGTINPGVYCGGISLSGGATLTMNPGVYIINGGNFSMSGGTTATASGVSIVLTNKPGGSGGWGTVGISGGATLTLTPMASGPMQGVAFYMDRAAPANSGGFNGGAHMAITGSLYLPSQHVTYSGGSSTGSACLQLIADTISFSGGSSFGTSCGSLVVPGLQPTAGPNGKGVPAE